MIEREDSIQFIEKLLGEGEMSNGGLNISVVCPFCKLEKEEGYNKRKLVIRTDDHRVHCWVCDYKSANLMHLVRKQARTFGLGIVNEYATNFLAKTARGKSQCTFLLLKTSKAGIELFEDYLEDVESEIEESPPELPEGFVFLAEAVMSNNITPYVRRHLDYLKKERGISSLEDLWYWKFCVAPQTDKEFAWRVIIPSFNEKGALNYFSGRSIRDHAFKYWNCDISKRKVIFNEYLIDWKKPLFLVEGPFDLIKTRLATSNVVPMLGKFLGEQYQLTKKIIENKTPIIIGLDPEETKYQLKMAEFFTGFGIDVSTLEYPEWVDDLGAQTEEQVKTLFQNNVKKYDTIVELRKRIERI